MFIRPLVVSLTLLAGVATLTRVAHAGSYEHPEYTVVDEGDGFELRDYAPRLEARVTVDGPYREATSRGFRVLAGFIFGGNQPEAAIDMTVPVTAVDIAMTAPVGAIAAGEGSMDAERWTITFMMPSQYTAETLPTPNDARIEIVETAPQRMAVRTFSWWATDSRSAAQLESLLAAVAAAGLEVTGPPQVAQYDAPWVVGPFRTNDVMVPVAGDRG